MTKDNDVVLKVDHLYKKFTTSLKRSMLYGSTDIAKSMLGIHYDTSHLRKGEFWALHDISFELKRGEALGIIGVNGSGKSTLLRLLTGIFPPDAGRIEIKGNVGSLIAVGAGFHPHMTGRENIYLNATILGMTKEEINVKFDSIVNFADIGKFIDAPISTYSSGMTVRLGFAIAIHCDPDILLIDEILSVGDLSFKNKSLRHMAEFREKANGLIFVSHDLEQIRNLCNKVIILDKGAVIFYGETQDAISNYEELTRDIRQVYLSEDNKFIRAYGSKISSDIELEDVGIMKDGKIISELMEEEEIDIFVKFKVTNIIEGLNFSISIHSDRPDRKNCVWVMSNENPDVNFTNSPIKAGEYILTLKLPNPHLSKGVYYPSVAIRNSKTFETYERNRSNIPFIINSKNNRMERGTINVKENWVLNKLK